MKKKNGSSFKQQLKIKKKYSIISLDRNKSFFCPY